MVTLTEVITLEKPPEEARKVLETLPPAQRRWVEHWIDSIARMIAFGPKGEPTEESLSEYRIIKNLLYEKIEDIIRYSERWKERLKRALGL